MPVQPPKDHIRPCIGVAAGLHAVPDPSCVMGYAPSAPVIMELDPMSMPAMSAAPSAAADAGGETPVEAEVGGCGGGGGVCGGIGMVMGWAIAALVGSEHPRASAVRLATRIHADRKTKLMMVPGIKV